MIGRDSTQLYIHIYIKKENLVNFDHKNFQLEIPNQEENNIKSSNIIFLLLTFSI